MAQCPAGHESATTDFCDVCGLPMTPAAPPTASPPGAAVTPAAPEPAPEATCPHCGAARHGRALFCEACGYDYTTGALPIEDLRTALGLTPTPVAAGAEAGSGTPEIPTVTPDAVSGTPDASSAAPDAPTGTPGAPTTTPPDPPTPRPTHHLPYVAEIWTDPQWYTFQESSDPLPPQGQPRIVPLRESALIGRRSVSRQIFPDIDCEPDPGVSRRQAYLTSADGYWYVSDLDSANGTFVGTSTGVLPAEPITARTLVGADSRIYVGAWTRLVIRPATAADEPTPPTT